MSKVIEGQKDPVRRQTLDQGGEATVKEGWREFRKITTIWARPMKRAFAVDTPEGVMRGKSGDWMACGQSGELYPIDGAIFAVTYEAVE